MTGAQVHVVHLEADALSQRRAKSANMRLTKPGYGNAGFEYLTDEVGHQNWIKPFDETVGYHGDRELSNADSALDFLSLFLNDDFWNLSTVETNRYAHQFLASHEIKPHSRFHQWYKADDHPDYILIEPCLKAALRQNTGVGSVG